MAPKVKRSEWKAPSYRAWRDCWVPSLDHPGYDGPERAWMLTSFSASRKHPQSSPDLKDAVPPFPLLPCLASSFSFASSASPNYSSSKQWRCQGFSSNSIFFCLYFISRWYLILTNQNMISELKSPKLTPPGFSKLQICTPHCWLKPPLGKLSDSFTCWKWTCSLSLENLVISALGLSHQLLSAGKHTVPHARSLRAIPIPASPLVPTFQSVRESCLLT